MRPSLLLFFCIVFLSINALYFVFLENIPRVPISLAGAEAVTVVLSVQFKWSPPLLLIFGRERLLEERSVIQIWTVARCLPRAYHVYESVLAQEKYWRSLDSCPGRCFGESCREWGLQKWSLKWLWVRSSSCRKRGPGRKWKSRHAGVQCWKSFALQNSVNSSTKAAWTRQDSSSV